jgi:hypothetical protein
MDLFDSRFPNNNPVGVRGKSRRERCEDRLVPVCCIGMRYFTERLLIRSLSVSPTTLKDHAADVLQK